MSDLRLDVDPAALGFADTSELLQQPLPWIGQERAEQAARFGLQMAQPDYNLLVLGEVGSGRTSLMTRLMRREAAGRPVPPDLCYLHNFEAPERPAALRLPAGEGRLLRQLMAEFAKKLQTEIPKRLQAPDAKAECERITTANKAQEDRDFATLSAFAEARNFGVMRDQGRMVFTQRDDQGEPLTAGKAMALSRERRAEIDTAEDALRAESSRFLETSRARERIMNEKVAALHRQWIKPVLDHEAQDIRNKLRKQIKDSVKLGRYLEQTQHDLLENLELFQSGDDPEDMRIAALVEEPGMVHAPVSAVSLQPEPVDVDVDVKIVLITSVEDYYALQEADVEFARRFRCKVDFAESFTATADTHRATAVFVAQACRRLGLPHFSATAAAALIEETHREAGDQKRQSAIFGHSEALLMESAGVAQSRGAALVEAQDVRAAIAARMHRHNYPEQRLQESITDGERLLDVHGERTGQVNGLTVVDQGDYEFGFPVRVTASVHAGDGGLLNIEREVEMSGPIHDKGVLILHSYLSALFAHIAPLALNAAVVFEQEYMGVEGDSASCAEFYVLLSALSGLPLRQGIAVTGAVNQHGEMLPVGGINEKIEGYFRSCELLGLDRRQGVLIPQRNRRQLMLSPHVVQAVANGRFHVYTAEHASDGMELLTGHDFGTLGPRGYAVKTVLGRAQKTLQNYRRACQDLDAHKPAHKPRASASPHRGANRDADRA